jgi:long-chain acyl-CoA synthetase
MLGYWSNESATRDIIDADGWLHTGDKARIDHGQIYITGRLKEIIVLANGEKIPPADMEMAICRDQLFEQAMIVGDNKPFLAVLLVLNRELWITLAEQAGVKPDDPDACNSSRVREMILERVAKQILSFPGYARIHAVHCQLNPWSIEDGLITPTLKLKRDKVFQKFESAITEIYQGH